MTFINSIDQTITILEVLKVKSDALTLESDSFRTTCMYSLEKIHTRFFLHHIHKSNIYYQLSFNLILSLSFNLFETVYTLPWLEHRLHYMKIESKKAMIYENKLLASIECDGMIKKVYI